MCDHATMTRAGGDQRTDHVELNHVRSLLERYGSNPMASLVLNGAGWKHFSGRSVEGLVCYLESRHTAVAWCDPLCAPADLHRMIEEFTSSMRGRRVRVCFLALQEPAARAAMASGHAALKIGEDPVFDLRTWRRPRGDAGKHLRWALNHAGKAGVVVGEFAAAEQPGSLLDAQAVDVQQAWEASLGRPAVRSFLGTDPLAHAEAKRIFFAERDGRMEALLACARVPPRDGWYLEDLIRRPDAVNGATELLVVTTLERFAADGAAFASIGVAPLRGTDGQIDRRARWMARALRFGFDQMNSVFHFASLSRFKSKFRPSAWEPRFAAFSPPRPSLRLARAVMDVLEREPAPVQHSASAG